MIEMERSAEFSPDGRYRYELIRDWSNGKSQRFVNWNCLNPSKAGAELDDMSVRKMVGFAQRWGYNGIAVTNLTAEISTDPWGLSPWSGIDPTNTAYQRKWIERGALIVAAWGTQPSALLRRIAMSELVYSVRSLATDSMIFHCIGQTANGSPLHPSRTGYTDAPMIWRSGL